MGLCGLVACGTSTSSPVDEDASGDAAQELGPSDGSGESSADASNTGTADAMQDATLLRDGDDAFDESEARAGDSETSTNGGPADAGGDADSGPPDAAGDSGAGLPDAGGDVDAGPPDAAGDSGAGLPDAGGDVDVGHPDAGSDAGAGLPDASGGADAGQAEADASDAGAVEGGPWFDASGIDASALCSPFVTSIPQVTVDYVDAAAPPSSAFTGGAIESGTYALAALTAYDGAFGNASTTGERLILDTSAGTIRNAYSDLGGTPVFAGYGFQPGPPGSNWFTIFALCPTSVGSARQYYTFSGTGTGATLTWLNGNQVAVLIKQ
jgi:hypothetical protein